MSKTLRERIKQTRFESVQQEALLDLLATANALRTSVERIVESYGITGPQFNVLRILRGVHPDGHPRCEIAARMLDHAPDVTRIIDRLEEKGLVARQRTSTDRRHSITIITKDGLKLLEKLDPELRAGYEPLRRVLSARDSKELSRICEAMLLAVGGSDEEG